MSAYFHSLVSPLTPRFNYILVRFLKLLETHANMRSTSALCSAASSVLSDWSSFSIGGVS